MFEKDLDRITCSLCLLQTSASLPPSLPHSLCTLFSPSLSLSLSEPPSPSSLYEECGRTCYSDACMTCWWQGLHSCCCLWWLFPAVSLLCVLSATARSSQSAHSQKQDLRCLTWGLEVKQTFDLVLRLIRTSTPSRLCVKTCFTCEKINTYCQFSGCFRPYWNASVNSKTSKFLLPLILTKNAYYSHYAVWTSPILHEHLYSFNTAELLI